MLLKLIILLSITNRSLGLDCFVCHSRQNPDCGDPFPQNGNSSGTLTLYECDRVKKVGEGLIAASNAIGGMPSSYTPLEGGSHVCYKITIGGHAVRGCAKNDFCANITDVCNLCNTDGCNGVQNDYSKPALLYYIINSIILLSISY